MKKIVCVILALTLSLAITACGGGATSTSAPPENTSASTGGATTSPDASPSTDGYTGGSYTLKLGHYFGAQQSNAKFVLQFADLVAEKSDGKIVIDVYGESQLGGQNELCEALHLGTIDLAVSDYVTFNSVLDHAKSIVAVLPWMLRDWDHAYAFSNSDIFADINKELLESYDIRYIGIMVEGFKELFSRSPVYNAEDFKGLRVRVTPQILYLEMFGALGAAPTQVATAELYTALQNGIVDAYERPADSAYTNSLWEQTNYMIMTNHVMAQSGIFINEGVFQHLDKEAQAIIIQAGNEITEAYFAWSRENDAMRLAQLVDECSQERIDIDTSELKAIAQENVWPILLENVDGAQAILATIEAMR